MLEGTNQSNGVGRPRLLLLAVVSNCCHSIFRGLSLRQDGGAGVGQSGRKYITEVYFCRSPNK